MGRIDGKRYWLVGASEGLGRAVARRMAQQGARLVISARSEDRLNDLAREIGGAVDVAPCDIQDADSVARAARAAGEIDGLVFLAGVYWPLGATEWSGEQIATMADVNFTGAVRVLDHVVPRFTERGAGHIVLTGSLSGHRGLPRSVGYAASKAGVMVLAEGLHADLRKTGVRVQLVNPGFIRTRLTDKNDFQMPFLMEPDEAARRFVDHMEGDAFARGFPWQLDLLIRAANLLPDALYYRLMG